MKCIAIDDEPLALKQLTDYISRVPFLSLVKSCQDAFEAMKVLADEDIDLIFVDINMPDLNGLDFIRSLISRPMVIFTTAYSEYAVDGFKLVRIDVKNIRYIEVMSEYVRIFIEGEDKPVITLASLQKMEERLPTYFMRVHRSYIVNLRRITEVSRLRIIFDKNTYIPVGDNYKERFAEHISKLSFS